MRHAEPIHPAAPLLPHCQPSLPAHTYFDEDRYRRELAEIWGRNWIYVARENDVAPGSIRRISVAGQNLILVRDREGGVTCFHNTCRHRGAELCSEPERRLKSRLIVCPYHQWSYTLQGDLASTPFVSVTDDFRREDHGLFRVHVREWNGFLFVCLSDAPPDFEKAPDMGAGYLDNWPMRDLVTRHRFSKVLNCNWKIFWENYNECLHCPGIHPELSEAVPIYGKGYMAANEMPGWSPESGAATGLKPGHATWSMNGRLCGPAFPGLTEAELEAGQHFVTLLPTMFVVAHADYVRPVSLHPLGPERTEIRAEWLFLPEVMAAPDFDMANVVDFATLVLQQDGEAAEMNQRGLRAAPFRQGVLMPQEFDVYRFQQWVLGQLA